MAPTADGDQPPYVIAWHGRLPGGDWLPGPSAFELWIRKQENLDILESLRPHEFVVLTSEVRA